MEGEEGSSDGVEEAAEGGGGRGVGGAAALLGCSWVLAVCVRVGVCTGVCVHTYASVCVCALVGDGGGGKLGQAL